MSGCPRSLADSVSSTETLSSDPATTWPVLADQNIPEQTETWCKTCGFYSVGPPRIITD
jgi:hypothetical protein